MELRHTLASFVVLGLAAAAAAETIRVPRDQPTIQAAVTAAGTGDVIEIASGKYGESVVIDGKTDLTIVGKGNVTLQPGGDDNDGLEATNCTNLTIRNVRVQGGGHGFEFQDCTGVLLERFAVKGAGGHGVLAEASSDVRVIRGKIRDVRLDGVALGADDDARPVTGGEISRVKVKECDEDGFSILGSNVMLDRCSVTNSDEDGFEVHAGGAGPVLFDRCKAKNSFDEGFELFGPNVTATKCSSVKSGGDGFDVEGDGTRLENCKAVKASASGLEIEFATDVTFLNCKSIRSLESGINIVGATDCLIDGCKSIRSRDNGFFLDAATSGITLRNNKGAKSSDEDLDDESGGANDIDDSNKFKTVDSNSN